MTDETQQFRKGKKPMFPGGSTLLNPSMRSVMAAAIVFTACGMCIVGRDVKEPLYSALMMVLGAMFQAAVNRSEK